MKRRTLAVMVAAVMTIPTMSLPGIAFAEQTSEPPSDRGNPSCFGSYSRTTKEVPDAGPGFYVSDAAQGLAQSPPPGNPHFAQTLQEIRDVLCPPPE